MLKILLCTYLGVTLRCNPCYSHFFFFFFFFKHVKNLDCCLQSFEGNWSHCISKLSHINPYPETEKCIALQSKMLLLLSTFIFRWPSSPYSHASSFPSSFASVHHTIPLWMCIERVSNVYRTPLIGYRTALNVYRTALIVYRMALIVYRTGIERLWLCIERVWYHINRVLNVNRTTLNANRTYIEPIWM